MQTTIDRYTAARRALLFWIALLALLVFAGAAVGFAHGATTPAAAPGAATPTRALPPGNRPARGPGFEPFPATEAMTETVRTVLEAYDQATSNGRRLDVGPVEVENHWTEGYLPLVHGGQLPSPTPTTPPPTPTMPPSPTPTTPPSSTPTTPPTPTPTATRVPEPVEPADIAVTLWPSPSIRVARNATLTYEVRVKNYGAGQANGVNVTLPYSSQQLTVTGSQFTKAGDWVSELTGAHVTVSFGPVVPGEYRTATIFFRASSTLPDNAVIDMRALYNWSDDAGGGGGRSNWAPVLGGGANSSAAWVWLTVDPLAGYAGTTHRFFTDRFIPGEGIHTWLNTPSGVQPLSLRGIADSMGRVTLDFRSSGLRPGAYSMVLYGARSNLTAIATFYVW